MKEVPNAGHRKTVGTEEELARGGKNEEKEAGIERSESEDEEAGIRKSIKRETPKRNQWMTLTSINQIKKARLIDNSKN